MSAIDKDFATLDANDLIYQVDSSRDYDPSPKLETITAPVMWINSADDFINPPELGIAEAKCGADQARQLRAVADQRPDPRPRHPHLGGGLEGPPGGVAEGERVAVDGERQPVRRLHSGNLRPLSGPSDLRALCARSRKSIDEAEIERCPRGRCGNGRGHTRYSISAAECSHRCDRSQPANARSRGEQTSRERSRDLARGRRSRASIEGQQVSMPSSVSSGS